MEGEVLAGDVILADVGPDDAGLRTVGADVAGIPEVGLVTNRLGLRDRGFSGLPDLGFTKVGIGDAGFFGAVLAEFDGVVDLEDRDLIEHSAGLGEPLPELGGGEAMW